jgi:SAM-dependent methyltransferase
MTVERLDPKTFGKFETLDHYARYVFASQFVPGKRVMDIACGLGYGAKLLRDAGASHVVAIDNSEEAITYAETHYGDEQIDYYCADAHSAANVVTGVFDVVVSFETIEHLERPSEFLGQCQRLAHRDTIFVLSVPNEAHLPSGCNPWHLHAFDYESFATLLRKHFESFTLIPQYFSTASIIDAVPDSEGADLTLGHTLMARFQAIPLKPYSYIAVCGLVEHIPEPNCIVHGPRFFSDMSQWVTELERAKTWLDEQRQTWMHTAEERATALADLKQEVTELERTKTWLDEQHQTWMHTAEERATALADLKQEVTELERTKTWLDEQRQTWMHTAEERATALADLKEELQQVLKTVEMTEHWAEQLLRVRAWLIEQREHQEVTLARQATQLAQALADVARCSEALSAITNSRGYRMLEWSRTKLLPFGTARGLMARSLLRWIYQSLRSNNP